MKTSSPRIVQAHAATIARIEEILERAADGELEIGYDLNEIATKIIDDLFTALGLTVSP